MNKDRKHLPISPLRERSHEGGGRISYLDFYSSR